MKYTLLVIILLFLPIILKGQDNIVNSDHNIALSLNKDGKNNLAKEKILAFDKALALGKFRQSQQVLFLAKEKNEVLQKENNTYIADLVDFFSNFSKSDSLLQSTLFYPDSVFQSNIKYSSRIKTLIPTILRIKKRKCQRGFSIIKGLSHRNLQVGKSANFLLTFEKYWPLEVIEFEKHIQHTEKELIKHSPKIKELLLFSQLENVLDSINSEIKIASLDNNVKNLQLQNKKTEQAVLKAKEQYKRLMYIGGGLFAISFLWFLFSRQKNNQLLKRVNQNLLEEKKRSNELLLNILPMEVAKELKTLASVKAKKHEGVTVLFTDFKNFSYIANQLTPEELVMELDYCFKEFDRIFDKHRLQKIKTIGDAYMCVGGLYTKGTNHIARMILAALEIQKFLERLKKDRKASGRHFFEARIGIHIGPIVSGVVGSKKFAFDIWGDTVNVAQQMETNGVPGKVNISGQTYELVKNQFEFTPRGKMTAKNKKDFEMYFVERKI